MPITSYEDMREKKEAIEQNLIEAANIIDRLKDVGLKVDGSALIDLQKKLNNDNFKVLIIGEFKNGKSTFINSLMGDKILPAYSTPCTAVINEVVYGDKKRATLYFKNPLPKEISEDIQPEAKKHIKNYQGKKVPPIELDVTELEDYVAIPDPTKEQAEAIQELPYSKVILEYPIELCRNGIEIIDSPGLNEHGTRTKVTEEYLNKADAIVFVFRCPKIAGQSEMDYINDQIHSRGYKDIFFVCNAINQIPEEEQNRLIRFGNKKLEPLTNLGKKGIFYVNALGALKAKQNKEFEELENSGLPQFEKALSEYLRNNKGKTKLLNSIKTTINYIKQVKNNYILSYRANLEQNVEEIEEKLITAMPKLEMAEQKKELVEQEIILEMEKLHLKIQELMKEQYINIIGKIPKVVDNLEVENCITLNIFKQASKKEALEKEIINKLEQFVQKEMSNWIKTELTCTINNTVNYLEEEIGKNIDSFYKNLDEFRYEISGVETANNISGFERVSATILGTIVGGPVYGAIGAVGGLGEVAKKSAIGLGAACALALTPLSITAIGTMLIGISITQFFTDGKALTNKYKNKVKEGFIKFIQENKEKNCKEYADSVVKGVCEQFDLISQALDEEIKIERSKIEILKQDKEQSIQEREKKCVQLKNIESELTLIYDALAELEEAIS